MIRLYYIPVGKFLFGAPALRRRERSARVRPRGAAGPKSARKSEIAAEPAGRSAGDVKIPVELSKPRRMQKNPVKKLQRLKHGAQYNLRGRGARGALFGTFFTLYLVLST